MRTIHVVNVSAAIPALALLLVVNDARAVTATVPGDFSQSCSGGCFRIVNTYQGSSVAITGDAGQYGMAGVVGTGHQFGVMGTGGIGVSGTGFTGVSGDSSADNGAGVEGSHNGSNNPNLAPGAGVKGNSVVGYGVWGHSLVNQGVS